MSNSTNENPEDIRFYDQAAKEIYNWLTDSEKFRLADELATQNSNIDDLGSREKLCLLLKFLEVNYVEFPGRVLDVSVKLLKLAEKNKGNQIADISFSEEGKENSLLSVVKDHVSDLDFSEVFKRSILEAGLSNVYGEYVRQLDINRLDMKELRGKVLSYRRQ